MKRFNRFCALFSILASALELRATFSMEETHESDHNQ